MLPFLFTGLALFAYMAWRGNEIAAQHAQSVSQAVAAASVSQATPAAGRANTPVIIGPPGSQTTITQTGASIAAHSASAPAYSPEPVTPTMIVTAPAQPSTSSTSASGAPTSPVTTSSTAVQSTPVVTVSAPTPPPHDVGTPPIFAPADVSSLLTPTSYAPVVNFTPTILSPAATCASIIPGQR